MYEVLPRDPVFICETCKTPNRFTEETPERPVCGKCGAQGIFTDSESKRFFTYYRRLWNVLGDFAETGFSWNGYDLWHNDIGNYMPKNMMFTHRDCGRKFTIGYKRWEKIIKEPGLFKCPKCTIHPRPQKLVREIFLCFRNVRLEGHAGPGFVWDIFSPIGVPLDQVKFYTWEEARQKIEEWKRRQGVE